ncbi:MAG: capsule assembly Wzi family protein [Pseudomonadota bacterium]
MRRHIKTGAIVVILGAMLCTVAAAPAAADAGWFESGDTLLRMDLQLLNDAEVIRLPLAQWPLPRAAVEYALANAREHLATNAAVSTALERVRGRIAIDSRRGVALDASLTAGEPGLLRDFDTLGREDAELRAGARYTGDRFAVSLNLTEAADPADGHGLRLDGSHATVQLGNWLLSAGSLDRWWGPSHESSLILSNNARPMPTLQVERAVPRPFETRWLSWLGPWRFNFGLSRMENERQDIDAPLFMAWRVEVMPLKNLELGFSRTAQFCGKQLECNLNVFGNLLAGNDNVGIDATAANEPGNQMAGFDVRWASPIGNWPYAVYSQMIGEDESSYTPAKYLMQLGAEAWKPFGDGSLLLVFAEYTSTTCSANSHSGPYYHCAYSQGRFNFEGYRYHGRVVGYTTDSDSETYSLGATYSTPGGDLWSATARTSSLNRKTDGHNTVALRPTNYSALELGWKTRLLGEKISVDLGAESVEPRGFGRKVEAFGFIGWRHEFRP